MNRETDEEEKALASAAEISTSASMIGQDGSGDEGTSKPTNNHDSSAFIYDPGDVVIAVGKSKEIKKSKDQSATRATMKETGTPDGHESGHTGMPPASNNKAIYVDSATVKADMVAYLQKAEASSAPATAASCADATEDMKKSKRHSGNINMLGDDNKKSTWICASDIIANEFGLVNNNNNEEPAMARNEATIRPPQNNYGEGSSSPVPGRPQLQRGQWLSQPGAHPIQPMGRQFASTGHGLGGVIGREQQEARRQTRASMPPTAAAAGPPNLAGVNNNHRSELFAGSALYHHQSEGTLGGLAEATLIAGSAAFSLEVANEEHEVDPEEVIKRQSLAKVNEQTEKHCHWMVVVLLVIVSCFLLGTILGVTLNNDNNNNGHDNGETQSLAPSSTTSTDNTPTETAAPTGALDLFLQELPESTLQNLQNSTTPQWKAFRWLSYHPELLEMEEWRKIQLFALATFYYAFGGPSWREEIRTEWMLYEKNECYWFSGNYGDWDDNPDITEYTQRDNQFGFDICDEAGALRALVFDHLDLKNYSQPFIPPELALLTSLTHIQLHRSGVKGTLQDLIPSELYTMPSLEYVDLEHNVDLSGTLPTEFLLLLALKDLRLDDCSLSGTIPTEYGRMTRLTSLRVYDNQLFGSLPTQLGMMTSMEELSVYTNDFTGTIPSEMGLLTRLMGFRAYKTKLTGTIPTELGLASSLQDLRIQKNKISGTIPTQIGLWSNMMRLNLGRNPLQGTIPSEIGLLTQIEEFYIAESGLTGSIPTEVGQLSTVERFYFFQNHLSGAIPSQAGQMTSMVKLELYENALTGPIPSELAFLTGMTVLQLQDNELSGFVPSELGRLMSMEELWLHTNSFGGPIPTELGAMINMTALDLSNNTFSGSIPTEFATLKQTVVLDLSSNFFSGLIPTELAVLTSLEHLLLNGNELSGVLPEELKLLGMNDESSLKLLSLAENENLLGTVPEQLCSLGVYNDTEFAGLDFDCSSQLCGCDWCSCSFLEINTKGNGTTTSPEDNNTAGRHHL